MRRPPIATLVTPLLGAVGLIVGLVVLSRRNLYEDEWLSLAFIQKPMVELWRWTIECGCHPPGALALDRLALLGLGSARGIAFVHLLFWLGCVTFFVLRAGRLIDRPWARAGFAAVAFMHPQSLMWAGTIRWYGVWWGLALVMVAVGLLPRRSDHLPSWAVTLALGVAGALLLYLDYLAFLLLPCFGVAWLVRYGPTRPAVARIAAIAGFTTALGWPVVRSFPDQQALEQCSAEVANHLAAALGVLLIDNLRYYIRLGVGLGRAYMDSIIDFMLRVSAYLQFWTEMLETVRSALEAFLNFDLMPVFLGLLGIPSSVLSSLPGVPRFTVGDLLDTVADAAITGHTALPRAFWEMFYPFGWRSEITEVAESQGLDPYLVAAVVRHPERQVGRVVVRRRGAVALQNGRLHRGRVLRVRDHKRRCVRTFRLHHALRL